MTMIKTTVIKVIQSVVVKTRASAERGKGASTINVKIIKFVKIIINQMFLELGNTHASSDV